MKCFLSIIWVVCFVVFVSLNESKKKVNYEGRIANGIPTRADHWPWMASLRISGYYRWDANFSFYWSGHVCGGSLIRSSYPAAILTNAHCFYDMENSNYFNFTITAQFNRTDVSPSVYEPENKINKTEQYYEYNIIKIVNNKHYWSDAYDMHSYNDTAIVFLNSSVDIEPIKLNDAANSADCCHENDVLTVIGYGSQQLWGQPTDTLETAQLQYVNDEQCNSEISEFLMTSNASYITDLDGYLESIGIDINVDGYPWNILGEEDSMFCAGGTSNACSGDSGSPLVKGTDYNAVQVGIHAFGWECDDEFGGFSVPSGHFDISYYADWIQQVLEENSITTTQTTTTTIVSKDITTSIDLRVYVSLFFIFFLFI